MGISQTQHSISDSTMQPGQSNAEPSARRGRPPAKPPGVEWEMVVRYRWDESVEIEIRSLNLHELEVKVTAKNDYGGATGSRMLRFDDVRKALDELERSAREVERL